MDYEKSIEIPFGAHDSELKGWEYTIPEGFTAEIKDGKVIVREKESENERMRKMLIDRVRSAEELTDELREWILTYLERHKESLHIPETCKDVIVAIEKYLDWLTGYPDYAPKGKYSIRDMLHCLSILEKQKEHKPVDFPTTDEEVNEFLETHPKVEVPEKYKTPDFVFKKKEYESHPIISKDTTSVKSAEWSDEDKAIVGCIACCLDGQFVTEAARKQCLEWFNKHRRDFLNRPSWKPSEEQIKALGNCFYDGEGCPNGDELRSLYNDLKKLRNDILSRNNQGNLD